MIDRRIDFDQWEFCVVWATRFHFLMCCLQSLLSFRMPGNLNPRKGGTARSLSQFSMFPVTCQHVCKATKRDFTLAQVYEHVMKGWHENKNPNLQPFYSRRNELTVHQGCIMWGRRVVIPTKLQSEVLQVLHESHVGVVRMKTFSRSYVWCPGIDLEIEGLAKGCSVCQRFNMPPNAHHYTHGSGHLPPGNVFMSILQDHSLE